MSVLDYGFWEITVEKQGRLKLPAGLLKMLPEDERGSFWITRGFGPYIMVWTSHAYREQMEYLNSLDRNIIEIKRYRNAFLSNTVFVECDSQDRFVIPKPLLLKYRIEKEVVLLLDNGKIEIWNSDDYHQQFDMESDDFEKLNQDIHLGKYHHHEERRSDERIP
ncbi:MAG: hypothetical protein LBR51_06715 [Bacteroidales bacterium]|nr:hypothetical protein [Bacteroidales bacterium]